MSEQQRGMLCAIGAYSIWGVIPVYFKLVDFATPAEIMAHRIVWCVLLLIAILALRGQFRGWLDSWRQPRILAWLLVSTTLIAINWFTFLWAVLNDRIVESSLGYYINPLVTVMLGLLVLGESLRPIQWLALLLAATGVLGTVVLYGSLPWVALTLAMSFGFYGLVRKRLGLEAISGLAVETSLLLPVGIGVLLWIGETTWLRLEQPAELTLLGLSAVVTAAPLILFAAAANRMPLSALAFVQFAAPTMSLAIGVLVYGEPFGGQQAFTFGLIWAALTLYCIDLAWQARRSPA